MVGPSFGSTPLAMSSCGPTRYGCTKFIPNVDPATALAVGLKVDVEALPRAIIAALERGQVDLTNPAVTVELLRLNAVVGVKGIVSETGQLTSVGITCALCHSSVDDSFAPGIGRRLDGWGNIDLNVGAIVALSPALDEATKAEFRTWGPGKDDPRHHYFDGTSIIGLPMNSPSLPVVIPSIYGLKGVGFETFTGDGPISYWNSYVGVGQMGGHGNFSDPRVGIFISQSPDLVTPKLPALLDYQLSRRTPAAPKGSFDSSRRRSRQESIPQRSRLRLVSPGSYLDGRIERTRSARAAAASANGSGHGSGVRGEKRHRTISDDSVAWACVSPAVLPRWQRCGSARRGQSLQSSLWAEPD